MPSPLIYTEEEARTKWCPLYDESHRGALCISSMCMAWRKFDQVGIGPNGEKRERDMDGRTKWVDRGYCGAFGNPVALTGTT